MIKTEDLVFWSCLIIANVWGQAGNYWMTLPWLIICAAIKGSAWVAILRR